MAVQFTLRTSARNQLINIDHQVRGALAELRAKDGIALVFCPHTTAAITINENADPDVQHDLLKDFERLAPARQAYYQHGEGNSDSHLKCSLVGTSEQILIENGSPCLGTWQSIYFCEFDGPRTRTVSVGLA